MPELPEVETVRQILRTNVMGKTIKDINIYYAKTIEYPTSDEFKKLIINEKINEVKRRGKWLMFELDHFYLLSHLRMEGKYNLRNHNDLVNKHEHVSFILDDDTELRYQDTRKFGRMRLVKKGDENIGKPFSELGLEPWDPLLTSSYLKDKYKHKKLPIKSTILDQRIIVGIGNIYADEILHISHINPLKEANKLTKEELDKIIKNTILVLNKAILAGGTTIRTFSAGDNHGHFQNELLVHAREGKQCYTCGTKILKIKVGGRGTYYCPLCQK